VDGVGNYWGPRGLLDLNADGISELPYRTVDLLGTRRETYAYVDLLAASPGLALLEEALRRVASLDVPTIIDEAPLMRPPTTHDAKEPH
jgi:nitrous oxidase accessory protein